MAIEKVRLHVERDHPDHCVQNMIKSGSLIFVWREEYREYREEFQLSREENAFCTRKYGTINLSKIVKAIYNFSQKMESKSNIKLILVLYKYSKLNTALL